MAPGILLLPMAFLPHGALPWVAYFKANIHVLSPSHIQGAADRFLVFP
jgi:hypothetical protein